MSKKSTGLIVCGAILVALAFYMFARQPKDELAFLMFAWLAFSGIGVIFHKKESFYLYLFGLIVFPLKAAFNAYEYYGDIGSGLLTFGMMVFAFGLVAPFIWARSEFLVSMIDGKTPDA